MKAGTALDPSSSSGPEALDGSPATAPGAATVEEVERGLEAALRRHIEQFRDDHGLPSAWDEAMSRLLSQCLWGSEAARLLRGASAGSSSGGSSLDGAAAKDFQEAVR
ncbi:hypothetical protein HK405_004724, partial [Cladochytrium tenue]